MPDYIDVPIDVDPDALAQVAFAELQAAFPGWTPIPGALDTITIEAISRIGAIIGRLASAVPTSVFRKLGPLAGIQPIEATNASVTTTWTVRDTAGYTIPAGTQVGIRSAAGDLIPFEVLASVAIAAPATATDAGAVTLVAIAAGATGSGLGAPAGPVELIDTLDFVTAIVQVDVTTGGVDAEADAAYLNRLRGELQLLAPRPIVPSDFAAMAQSVAGISRALAIDLYKPAINELQTITVDATAGTFTLTFTGQTTGVIARNASAGTVQAALEALSNIAPGDVIVTGGPLTSSAITVEFAGAYAGTNVAQMTADSTLLTGGTHTATIATTRAGAAAVSNSERTVTVAVVDEAGNEPSGAAITAAAALLQAKREVNFLVYVIGPTYTGIDVSFTITVIAGFDADAVLAAAEDAVTAFLSPANWGQPTTGDQASWVDEPTVRYNDLAWVLRNVQGVKHVTVLTLDVADGTPGTADVTLTGPAAMPTPGAIVGATA